MADICVYSIIPTGIIKIMSFFIHFLKRTIGQKIVVGLTGLGLCLFVLIHMLGNLFILSGPEAYNNYAHQLHELPFLTVLEVGLLIFFLGHIVLSILLAIQNKQAKGTVSYKKSMRGNKASSPVHSLLIFQGGILFIFLIFHLLSFKFGPHYETTLKGETVRDIYQLVVENFKKPLYTIGYSFALFILFIHLLRGLTASFKTFGLSHPIYLSFVEKLAWIFALVVTFGFLVPIWYVFIYL